MIPFSAHLPFYHPELLSRLLRLKRKYNGDLYFVVLKKDNSVPVYTRPCLFISIFYYVMSYDFIVFPIFTGVIIIYFAIYINMHIISIVLIFSDDIHMYVSDPSRIHRVTLPPFRIFFFFWHL